MTVNQKCVVLDGVALSMCMVEGGGLNEENELRVRVRAKLNL